MAFSGDPLLLWIIECCSHYFQVCANFFICHIPTGGVGFIVGQEIFSSHPACVGRYVRICTLRYVPGNCNITIDLLVNADTFPSILLLIQLHCPTIRGLYFLISCPFGGELGPSAFLWKNKQSSIWNCCVCLELLWELLIVYSPTHHTCKMPSDLDHQ